jgi:hypothetical protein
MQYIYNIDIMKLIVAYGLCMSMLFQSALLVTKDARVR